MVAKTTKAGVPTMPQVPAYHRPFERQPEPTWDESKAAYANVRDRFAIALKPKVWDRKTFIAHYEAILANPDAKPFAKNHAREALANLKHSAAIREPGSDDE